MSIKKNFLYNVLYQILIIILPLITTPYISRVIGPEGVGTYSYAFSIANYFVIIAMLGINNYGNRSIASVRDDKEELNKTFSSILIFHILMSFIMIIAYIIYIILFVKSNRIIFITQLVFVISALFDINWFFFGLEKFKLTVIRNTIIKIITVLSIFIFVRSKNDLWIYSLILAAGNLISQCLLWPFLKKFVKFKKPTFKEVILHLRPCSILFIPVVAVSIYKVMDKIMLGSIGDMMQVGFFENSEKIINIPLGIVTALGTVMLPKMSNLNSKKKCNENTRYIFMSIQFAMFIAFGSLFGLLGVGKTIIPIFLGEQFNECVTIVSLLAISILFIAWANVIRTQYIIPNKLDKVQVISTIIGAIVNFIINIILIGKMGAIGAAVGTIFAEISVAGYVTFKIRNELPVKKYFQSSIPFIILGFFMWIIIEVITWFMGTSTLISAIIQVLVGGFVYLFVSVIYLIKSKSEIGEYIILKLKKLYK